jgi:predicted nucleic acid-binding protein
VIFVDTGAWFARYVASDVDHVAAVAWFGRIPDKLVTTDYVLDDLLTLLKVRGFANIACAVGDALWAETACAVEKVTTHDLEGAWHVFSTYRDKQWSFTDCVSRVVMERLGVTTACAFDEHFRQFGTIAVVP